MFSNFKIKINIILTTLILIGFIFCSYKFYINNNFKDGKPIIISTKSGIVIGLEKDGVKSFRGIYYAEPPIGKNRFAPTIKKRIYPFIINATKFSPFISQPKIINNEKYSLSEKALTLNIWTKSTSKKSKLPVFVLIHGGAFLFGTANSENQHFIGVNYANKGIIYVTINYRLNVFGFLPLKTTLKKYNTTGNWGVIDIITGLQWIKDNISDFGGDPDNITICGISAGSTIVSALISSPKASSYKGHKLFQKAIMLSNALPSLKATYKNSKYNLNSQIKLAQDFISNFDLKDNENDLKILQKINPEIIISYLPSYITPLNIFSSPFIPVADGDVIPFDFLNRLHEGNVNNVKLMVGYNTNESSMFINDNKMNTPPQEDYQNQIEKIFGKYSEKIIKKFPIDNKHSAADRIEQIYTMAMFTSGLFEYADSLSQNNNVYVYHFNYIDDPGQNLGVYHTSDVKYIFKENINSPFSDILHTGLINFIKTGDPNTGKPLPFNLHWGKYSKDNPCELIIQEDSKMTPIYNIDDIYFIRNILFNNENME